MGTNAAFFQSAWKDVANCNIVTWKNIMSILFSQIMSILFSQISGKNLSILERCVPGIPPHAHRKPGDEAMSVHDVVCTWCVYSA